MSDSNTIIYKYESRLDGKRWDVRVLKTEGGFLPCLNDATKILIAEENVADIAALTLDKVTEGEVGNVIEIEKELYTGAYDATLYISQCDDLCQDQQEYDRIRDFFTFIDDCLIGLADVDTGKSAVFLPMVNLNIKEMASDGISQDVVRDVREWIEKYLGITVKPLSDKLVDYLKNEAASTFRSTAMESLEKSKKKKNNLYSRDDFATQLGYLKRLTAGSDSINVLSGFKDLQHKECHQAQQYIKANANADDIIKNIWHTEKDKPAGECSVNYQYYFLCNFLNWISGGRNV